MRTDQKLDPQLALESAARWHRDNRGSGSTLNDFANDSPWVAVRTPSDRWSQVTGTAWSAHSAGIGALDWPTIRNQLGANAAGYSHLSYSNNVVDLGYLTWNIKSGANLLTDSGRPIIFDGGYQTLLVTARKWDGDEVCRYYYTYETSGAYPIEVWVWDNNWDTDNNLKYAFARECNGPFPEGRSGSSAGYPTLSQPAIITSETLSVSLTANPSSGTAPLNDVDFTATVSGSATGTINYTFYANRSDDGINITPDYCFKINGRNPDGTGGTVIYQGSATDWTGGTTFTVYDVYNYTPAGTYTAKVIAERGTCQAQDRIPITVNPPTPILERIEVGGSTQVNENSGAQYTCTAYYSDGSTSNVTNSASWSENSAYATISSTGYLTTSSVTSDQPCTITATYSGYSDTQDVTIKDVPPDEFWKSPTATGATYNNWHDPTYAFSSDNQRAWRTYADHDRFYDDQNYRNFRFDIPEGAIIDGIEIRVEGYCDQNVDNAIRIDFIGHDGSQKSQTFGTSEEIRTYGGSNDLWGASWSASDFSDENFNLNVVAYAGNSTAKNYVDHIQAKVYYHVIPPPDTNPDPFTFVDQTGVELNTVVTSNAITVTGINAAAPISITGGTYSINGSPYTSASGTVDNGNTVMVRVTSSSSYSTTVNATLTIGDVSDTFSVTTESAPQTGNLQVTLGPGEAVSAGAQWNVDGGAWQNSGDTVTGLSVGSHTVNYKAVTGWTAPPSEQVNINSGETTYATGTYSQQEPSVEFATTSSSGPEAVSPAILAVNLSGASAQTVTVDYSVTGGTGTGGGVDYTLASGTLTFSPGDTTGNVQIMIIDDPLEERDETIIVALSNPTNARLGTNVSHTYTIVDNDGGPPKISGHIPQPNSFQVARDTIIQIHITDGGSGVEYSGGTVTIQVEGDLIYDGANENPEGVYDSTASSQAVKGVCRRTGTAADYTFVFQPSTLFDYEQKVDVVVSATDKASNSMTQTYYFYTVMREFGKNVKVNSDTGALVQDRPATATDSVGNIWVVWDQTTVAGDTDIYVGRLQADSSTFGSSVHVAGGADYQQDPAIAIDNADTIYVAWQGDDVSGKWDIFVSTSVNGTSWSTPIKVSVGDPNNDSDQTAPAIAIDGNNKAYVVWEDNRAGNKDIWVATSTDATTWTNTQVATNASDQSEPAVAIDSDNVAYIVWTDARNLGTAGTDIYGAASDEGPWTNVPIVTTAGNQSSPAIASGSSGGGLHLLWVHDASGNADIFYGATTDGFAATPLAGASIIDEANTIQAVPSIAVSSGGNSEKVFACWQDARNVVSNNGDTDIYFAETGSDFGTNILVNDDVGTNAQTYPVIGTDKDGCPYIVWVDTRSGNKDIYYAGATTIGPALPTTSTTSGGKTIVELNGANAGYVDDASDVIVEIPAGATPSSTTITISEIRNLPQLPPGGFGVYYDFGPSGLQFNAPVTITIPHAAADCPGLPIYKVYWYNTQIGAWSTTGVSNIKHLDDTAPNIAAGLHAVQFDITHFTTFGASATAVPPTGGGGGGGGGGCSVSPQGQGGIAEFVLPYAALVTVLLLVTWIDSRRPRTKHQR